jgi:hypothetical protein
VTHGSPWYNSPGHLFTWQRHKTNVQEEESLRVGSDQRSHILWYNLGVASLPAKIPEVPPPSPRARKLAALLKKGWPIDAIVDKLANGDDVKAHIIRTQIGRLIDSDEEVQKAIGSASSGILKGYMTDITHAVARRGSKGNIPAAKLAMEASGFHNPRMDHHHSGKIEIELKGVPRPERVVDEDNVVDADVVDE